MKLAQVGVLFDEKDAAIKWECKENIFGLYLLEVLAHGGIPFKKYVGIDEIAKQTPDVLIVAHEDGSEETATFLWEFAENGGIVISFAGLSGLAKKFGFMLEDTANVGYARLPKEYGDPRPLRYLGAVQWKPVEYKPHVQTSIGNLFNESPDGVCIGAALTQFEVGAGAIDRWAVDIPATIVGLQQGTRPVEMDGKPASDGTGAIDEGILKADDGFELDWKLDRLKTETGAPYFAHPYADLWREVVLTHLLKRIVNQGMTLPMIDYWPDGISCVAMISHDSDINQDVHAESTLQALKDCGINSTWCMIEPGYSTEIYKRVIEDGHELAFHYNALDEQGGAWGEEEFSRQFKWFKDATGIQKCTSNKNHYTRFEGWGELFRWCEKNGIEADQTRGPSKKGNIGFLFGTCHPYYPIALSDEKNRLYNVLEMGMLTQDLDHRYLADSSVVIPFSRPSKESKWYRTFSFPSDPYS